MRLLAMVFPFLIVTVISSSAFAQTVGWGSAARNPCAGVTCSGRGRCVIVRGQPTCSCQAGYTADATGINWSA